MVDALEIFVNDALWFDAKDVVWSSGSPSPGSLGSGGGTSFKRCSFAGEKVDCFRELLIFF